MRAEPAASPLPAANEVSSNAAALSSSNTTIRTSAFASVFRDVWNVTALSQAWSTDMNAATPHESEEKANNAGSQGVSQKGTAPMLAKKSPV